MVNHTKNSDPTTREKSLVALQRLLDDLPRAAFAASPDGKLIAANALACAMFAEGGPWLTGLDWWGGLKEPDAAAARGVWTSQAPRGHDFGIELGVLGTLCASPTLRAPSSAQAWLVARAEAATDARQGSPLSEPAHLAPALNTALQAARMGLWKWSIDSDAAFWSPELYDLLRLPRGAGIEVGARFMGMILEEDRAACNALVESLLTTGAAMPTKFRIRAGDGSIRWFASSAHKVVEADGSASYVGVNFDLTGQIEAEQTLREAQAQRERDRGIIDSVLEHAPVAIAVTINGQEDLSLVNRHALAMIEVDQSRGRAWDAWQVYRQDGDPAVRPEEMALHRASRGEVIKDEEWLVRRTDGTLIPVSCSAGPILGPDRTPIGAVVAWHDVSAFKAAQMERQFALAAETAAREAAEADARQKDVFLGIVSHELRTPLGAILGWTDMLKRSANVPAERATASIERNARALARLVDDLLDVTRMSVGKLPMVKRMVEFGQVARAALETVQPAANAASVVLQLRQAEGDACVRADPLRLQQAIWNLLANAVKFSAEGGLVLVSEEIDGDEIVMRVSDYGAGIEPEKLARVFDRFWQDADAPHRAGLGLGLYISRRLVEQHGGSLTAYSAGPGRGATFTLRLPIAREG